MSVRATFPNDVSSVPAARHLVSEALADLPAATRDRALLMVSELATNALKHASSGFSLSVEHGDGTVRVEVSDAGHGQPTVRHPSPSQPTGRGLQIVGALSHEWGVRPSTNGKVVWFTLAAHGDAAPAGRY